MRRFAPEARSDRLRYIFSFESWETIVSTANSALLPRQETCCNAFWGIARVGLGRPVSDKPNHRHRRLLRPHRERPRRRRAAECDQQLPPSESARLQSNQRLALSTRR